MPTITSWVFITCKLDAFKKPRIKYQSTNQSTNQAFNFNIIVIDRDTPCRSIYLPFSDKGVINTGMLY